MDTTVNVIDISAGASRTEKALAAAPVTLLRAVPPYTTDHSFSKAVSECFAELGDWSFVNPISCQPWGGRNSVVARIRICEKYLTTEDVFYARWLRQQAMAKDSGWESRDIGMAYLSQVMNERSGDKWIQEMAAIAKGLPSVMDYAEAHFGLPTSAHFAQSRRASFKVIEGSGAFDDEVSVAGEESPGL